MWQSSSPAWAWIYGGVLCPRLTLSKITIGNGCQIHTQVPQVTQSRVTQAVWVHFHFCGVTQLTTPSIPACDACCISILCGQCSHRQQGQSATGMLYKWEQLRLTSDMCGVAYAIAWQSWSDSDHIQRSTRGRWALRHTRDPIQSDVHPGADSVQ